MRNPEAWLKQHNLEYRYEAALHLDAVDETASADLQSRIGGLNPTVVEQYAVGYEQERDFPPIVVFGQGTKLVCLDGNHRRAAARQAKLTSLPAFVAESIPPSTLLIMVAEVNTDHGSSASRADREAHALRLAAEGLTYPQISQMTGLSTGAVGSIIRADLAERRARELVDKPTSRTISRLPSGHKNVLTSIKSDPVFAATARLMATSRMSNVEATEMAKQIRAARSDDAGLAVVRRYAAKEHEPLPHRHMTPTPAWTQLNMTLGAFLKIDMDAALHEIPDSKRESTRMRVVEASERVAKLLDRL